MQPDHELIKNRGSRIQILRDRPKRMPIREMVFFGLLLLTAILIALGIAAMALLFTGNVAEDAFSAILKGSLGSVASLSTTLNHTAPILLVAVGACIAGKASLVNIGQEGQFVIGATVGFVSGQWLPGPAIVTIPATLIASFVGGGLWSGIAGVLRHVSGVSEVISTLLLNFIAFALVSLLVNRPWLLQETPIAGSVGSVSPQTDPISEMSRLPVLVAGSGYRLHSGIVVAIGLALIVKFIIARTVFGFRLRMFGNNPRAAVGAGVSKHYASVSLVLSGAFAGLAGGVVLAGVAFRVNPGLSNNFGWEGLLVALVSGYSAVISIIVAFLFGALRAGGGVLTSTGVNPSIVGVVQSLVVLAVTLPGLLINRRRRRALLNSQAASSGSTTEDADGSP